MSLHSTLQVNYAIRNDAYSWWWEIAHVNDATQWNEQLVIPTSYEVKCLPSGETSE